MPLFNPGATPLGAALIQPPVPTPGPASTADPEQRNIWQKFMQRLDQDPNLRMALLSTGLNLLKDPNPGSSGFDQFANSALTGVQTLDTLRQRESGQQIQARQEDRADRRVDLQEEGLDVQRESLGQRRRSFDERMNIARDRLDETKRHNRAIERPSAAGASTGQERTANTIKESLMTLYPEAYAGPQGEAKANLDALRFTASTDDEAARARTVASLAEKEMEIASLVRDEEITLEEALSRAAQAYDGLIRPFVQGPETAEATQPADLNGRVIALPNQGEFTIRSLEDGKFKLVNQNGVASAETFSAEQLQPFLKE